MTTPPLDLTAFKEIATTATPGEWSIENITSTDPRDRIGPFLVYSETQNADGDLPAIVGSPDDGIPFADARHIAAFDPPTVLALIARAEAAERDLAAVTVSRDGWQTRAEAAEKKVAKVREVHPRVVIAVHESHGEEAMCPQCQHHYPCPTITALDTHTPETETP